MNNMQRDSPYTSIIGIIYIYIYIKKCHYSENISAMKENLILIGDELE